MVKKTSILKECICGNKFLVQPNVLKHRKNVYCSVACANKGHKRITTRFCKLCNKEFQCIPSKNKRFCCYSCAAKSREMKGRTEEHRHKLREVSKKRNIPHCKNCGGFLSPNRKHKCIIVRPPTPEETARRIATWKKNYVDGKFKVVVAWTGKHRDETTIQKMRESMKLKWANPDFEKKMVFVKGHKQYNSGKTHFKKGMKGELNHSWKGGITPLNTQRWHSNEYQQWRRAIFNRDDYTCQIVDCPYCGNVKGGEIQAHHIESMFNKPELGYAINNGISFCRIGHNMYHREYGWKHGHKAKKKVKGTIKYCNETNTFVWHEV